MKFVNGDKLWALVEKHLNSSAGENHMDGDGSAGYKLQARAAHVDPSCALV